MNRPSGSRFLPRESDRRERLLMSIGTGTAVAVPLVLAPVWGRTFPVSDFALAALAQVVPGIITSWAGFSYQGAIQTPAADRDAIALTALALLLTAVMALLTAIVLLVAGPAVARALGSPGLAGWLWVVPILIAANSCRLVLDQWMVRHGALGEIGFSAIASTGTTAGVMALGLWFPDATNFVLLGVLVGTVVGAGWRVVRSRFTRALRDNPVTLADLRAIAWEYRNFPRDGVAGGVVTNVGLQLPQVLLARYFGAETVGQYARASVLIGVPSSILGQPLGASLAIDAGRSYRERGDSRNDVRRVAKALLFTLGPLYAVLGVFAPVLLPLFLGPAWELAGRLAQPMVVSMFAVAVGGPMGAMLLIANRTGLNLGWQVCWVLACVGSLLLGVRSGTPIGALWLLAVANLAMYGVYGLLAYRVARAPSWRAAV